MPRIKNQEFIEQLDKIGCKIQRYLSKERRNNQWFADEIGISSVTLRKKMKDDKTWTRLEMVMISKILKIKLRL